MAPHTPGFVRVPVVLMFVGLAMDVIANGVLIAIGDNRKLVVAITAYVVARRITAAPPRGAIPAMMHAELPKRRCCYALNILPLGDSCCVHPTICFAHISNHPSCACVVLTCWRLRRVQLALLVISSMAFSLMLMQTQLFRAGHGARLRWKFRRAIGILFAYLVLSTVVGVMAIVG